MNYRQVPLKSNYLDVSRMQRLKNWNFISYQYFPSRCKNISTSEGVINHCCGGKLRRYDQTFPAFDWTKKKNRV